MKIAHNKKILFMGQVGINHFDEGLRIVENAGNQTQVDYLLTYHKNKEDHH